MGRSAAWLMFPKSLYRYCYNTSTGIQYIGLCWISYITASKWWWFAMGWPCRQFHDSKLPLIAV